MYNIHEKTLENYYLQALDSLVNSALMSGVDPNHIIQGFEVQTVKLMEAAAKEKEELWSADYADNPGE